MPQECQRRFRSRLYNKEELGEDRVLNKEGYLFLYEKKVGTIKVKCTREWIRGKKALNIIAYFLVKYQNIH